ncbi:fasciclin domain-containing protein [Aegicerativicinus sediminis]
MFTKLPQIALITFLTFTLASCDSDSVEPIQDEPNMSLYETIDSYAIKFDNSTAERNGAPKKGDASIAAIASGGGFSRLVDALMYVDSELDAGLVNLFANGKDQYTVFAPTNDAFDALYSFLGAEDETDLAPELVLNVLLYHVTDGRRASNSVVPKNGMRTIETLLGPTFDVYPDLKIMAVGNSANIVGADISANNGIIHVIDQVILPIEVD